MLKDGAFLGGNAGLSDYKQRENYWINVKLKLKVNKDDEHVSASTGTKLYESMEVYHCNDSNKEAARSKDTESKWILGALPQVAINSIANLKSAIEKVNAEGKTYTKFTTGEMIPATSELLDEREVNVFTSGPYISGGYITLIYRDASGNASDMNPDLVNLLNRITTITSSDAASSFTYTFRNRTKADYRIWTQVVWKTVLSDLKSRKFTCTDFTYNNTTGRVNEIVFEEI